MNEYKLLTKQEDYDLPTVKELASAMNELAQMEQRRAFLENLIRVNGRLKKHIWKDKNGLPSRLPICKTITYVISLATGDVDITMTCRRTYYSKPTVAVSTSMPTLAT